MLKDIDRPLVEDVAVAIAPELSDGGEEVYYAWLINLRNEPLETILIRSSGYGVHDGTKYETSELRRFYDKLDAQSAMKIEPVLKEALVLSNQYWVSFYIHKVLYDKKYVFVPGSIDKSNYIALPFVGHEGAMIK